MPKAIIIFLCIILFVVIGWNYFRTKNGGMIEGLDASANTTAPSSSGTTTTTGSGTGTTTGSRTGTATGSGTSSSSQQTQQTQQTQQSKTNGVKHLNAVANQVQENNSFGLRFWIKQSFAGIFAQTIGCENSGR